MTFFITPFHYTDCFSVRQIGYGGKTVARECIAANVAYILEWFNIPIDTEEAIRERDW